MLAGISANFSPISLSPTFSLVISPYTAVLSPISTIIFGCICSILLRYQPRSLRLCLLAISFPNCLRISAINTSTFALPLVTEFVADLSIDSPRSISVENFLFSLKIDFVISERLNNSF